MRLTSQMFGFKYNGENGCPKCLQSGITYNLGEHRHTHIYPFCSDAPDGPKWTKEQHHADEKSAFRWDNC